MARDGPSSYDVVPYRGRPFAETHPDTLATIGTLFGMKPPKVARARVLEIGCASGENLIPMAVGLPDGWFLGIDPSEREVADGRATIEAAGLKNVELRQVSVEDVGPELGTFDYIICHGVFSWVAPEVQQRILSLCARTLAASGLAYVSYNAYPGWHLRGVLRDAMHFHIRSAPAPEEGIRRAREILDFLVEFAWEPANCYSTMIRELRERLVRGDDSYLFHEFLEEVNQPLYYHEFLERAADAGLEAVADADFAGMACVAPEPIKGAIERISAEPARQEEYLDFLRGRTFRRTLLCHRATERLPRPSVEAVERLQAAARLPSGSLSPDLLGGMIETFQNWRDQTITLDHPAIKAAVLVLGEQWPRAMPFRDLWREVGVRVSRAGLHPSDCAEPQRRRLAEFLLHGYSLRWVELHSHMASFVREPGERPVTTPLARYMARAGGMVPNLRHELVDLPRFDRHLLLLLDQPRTESDLVDALDTLVTEGQLTLRTSEPAVLDAASRRAILADNVRQGLSRLAGCALLVA